LQTIGIPHPQRPRVSGFQRKTFQKVPCYSSKVIFTAKAILFDMDGVLIDSTPAVERVWRKWAIEHRLNPDTVIEQAHGRRSIETIRAVAPHMDAERENLNVEQMEIDDKEGVTALPGASQMLRCLPPERFAIVTSATRPLAVARLGYANLPVPRFMVTADDVREGKPSPQPFLAGAALLGVTPEDCLVFEDTPAGVAAARAANMQVIAVSTTYSEDELQSADVIAESLAEVQPEIGEQGIALRVAQAPRKG
jgi:sugar-phosphatase